MSSGFGRSSNDSSEYHQKDRTISVYRDNIKIYRSGAIELELTGEIDFTPDGDLIIFDENGNEVARYEPITPSPLTEYTAIFDF